MFDTQAESRVRTNPRINGRILCGLLFLTIALAASARTAQAQGTSFMYQGRLTEAGANANGPYDLEFKL